MYDVEVQHEVQSIQTSPLLTVLVTVIPKPSVIKPFVIVTAAPTTTIPLILPPFFSTLQQSTLIPTPTTVETTTSTTVILESTTLSAIHQRVFDLEKEVKILRNSILEDEDAMDKGVANKLKKRKPNDVDRDETLLAGHDQGLREAKTIMT
ncbi:hypothetical protein Tco_1069114 [Tanacetum coccineum]|uniref:Uncharacterized protein n=1 Tax=Tanacetum coccineum TaxID=301880 RepID=A0ABQ5HJJ7_9ASTR